MGFFFDLVGGIFNAFVQVGTAVAKATQEVAREVVSAAKILVDKIEKSAREHRDRTVKEKLLDERAGINDELISLKRKHEERGLLPAEHHRHAELRKRRDQINQKLRELDLSERPEPASQQQEQTERQLQQINEEILALRKRYFDRGGLTEADRQRSRQLTAERARLSQELGTLDKFNNAETIVREEKDYQVINIADSTTHILQYHVGQSTYNKACPVCGRPMVLQWRRDQATVQANEVFWGCSGWYHIDAHNHRACTQTARLSPEDLSLFANRNRKEFELTPTELDGHVRSPQRAARLQQVVESIRSQQNKSSMGIDGYRCPIHGERLRLRSKRDATDNILDRYFLGCPRWLPNNQGCGFLVKLKSPAQLAAVVNAQQHQSMLSIID
ncbi:Zn-finger domain associated with topoisomerase type I [Thiorhodovibrio winogradskyi]|uniref:Zn-finger domain associated with topoisomerase type I n=1 Tax=Thiorhodovibrio winogradskyi TaxID=77007 RepID=A0ABZ0SEN3_9GAMM|nr:hypothetical protein [Thiorhodovibrio winogradskyi]